MLIITRACAKVGIIALIDEATGYEAFKKKQELQFKVQAFIAEDLQALNLLVEGCGIRVTSRITGLHQETVLALLEKAGERSAKLLDTKLRNLKPQHVQVDEVWSFVHCKQKNIRLKKIFDDREIGDQYTFIVIDRDTKLVISHLVGKRNIVNTSKLMDDLAKRVESNFQLTTDGFKPYVEALEWAFGSETNYAQLIKLFAENEPQRERYSPSHCIGAVPVEISGTPDPVMICTSHVERNNLTLRTFLRRLTRLSLGFSKKLEHLKHAVALHFAFYNFCRVHRSLRVTPAMQAGITDHEWSLGELRLEQ